MSLAARIALVRPGGGLIFQRMSQRFDLLNPLKTRTELIASLRYVVGAGYAMECTAIRTDHHDDRGLQSKGAPWEETHGGGFAVDLWLLRVGGRAGDYEDASTPRFRAWLATIARSPYHGQTGLVGDGADCAANFAAAGPTAFEDAGAPHTHMSCKAA